MGSWPGFVRELEGERAFGEALLKDGEGFGGGGVRVAGNFLPIKRAASRNGSPRMMTW